MSDNGGDGPPFWKRVTHGYNRAAKLIEPDHQDRSTSKISLPSPPGGSIPPGLCLVCCGVAVAAAAAATDVCCVCG